MAPEHECAAAQARFAASALAAGSSLDLLGTGLILLALAMLAWAPGMPASRAELVGSLLVGIAGKIAALRVAFDRRIFTEWARLWKTEDGPAPEATLAAFDQTLEWAGSRRPTARPNRDLDSRIRGVMGLLKRQALLVGLQFLLVLGAALAGNR